MPAQPPWPDVLRDCHDLQRSIEEDDVDRKGHPNRVDAAQRIRQQQSKLLINAVATE
jgi:hypothetical protein